MQLVTCQTTSVSVNVLRETDFKAASILTSIHSVEEISLRYYWRVHVKRPFSRDRYNDTVPFWILSEHYWRWGLYSATSHACSIFLNGLLTSHLPPPSLTLFPNPLIHLPLFPWELPNHWSLITSIFAVTLKSLKCLLTPHHLNHLLVSQQVCLVCSFG